MSEPRVYTSAWWDPETWARVKSAVVFDREHQRSAPKTFIGWMHQAIERHAARSARSRARLDLPPRPVLSEREGLRRSHPLRVETREVLERAVADRELGRDVSLSVWIHEAVTAAISDAKRRAGRRLPTAGA